MKKFIMFLTLSMLVLNSTNLYSQSAATRQKIVFKKNGVDSNGCLIFGNGRPGSKLNYYDDNGNGKNKLMGIENLSEVLICEFGQVNWHFYVDGVLKTFDTSLISGFVKLDIYDSKGEKLLRTKFSENLGSTGCNHKDSSPRNIQSPMFEWNIKDADKSDSIALWGEAELNQCKTK